MIGLQATFIRDYVQSLMTVLSLSLMATIVTVNSLAANAVAGERERHTLETLLAQPVRSGTLYWGKFASLLLMGLASTGVAAVLGLVTVTAVYGAWVRLPIALVGLVVVLFVSLAIGFLFAALGLLVSARSRTFQQANVLAALLMLPILVLLTVGPVAGALIGSSRAENDPGNLAPFVQILVVAVLAGVVLFFALGALLVWLGLRRFERNRLMLS